MGRLIDADLLLENYNLKNADKLNAEGFDTLMKYEVADMIKDAPTVDAVRLVYGEWVERKTPYAQGGVSAKCSVCYESVQYLGNPLKYCPNCGAKMDGKGKK